MKKIQVTQAQIDRFKKDAALLVALYENRAKFNPATGRVEMVQ